MVEHLDADPVDLRPSAGGRHRSASSPRWRGSLVGVWVGERLASDDDAATPLDAKRRHRRRAAIVAVIVGFAAYKPAPEGVSARGHAGRRRPGRGRPDRAHVARRRRGRRRVHQRHLVAGRRPRDRASSSRPASPASTRPTSRSRSAATWKTMVRSRAATRSARCPSTCPRTRRSRSRASRRPPSFERPFVADHEVLQREQKDVAGWLTIVRLPRRRRDRASHSSC